MKLLDEIKKTVFAKREQPIRTYLATYRIAGMTFDNEDGSSRQKIVKAMKEYDHVKVIKYFYEGKPAFKIVNCKMQQIGNIKEKDVPFVDRIYQQYYDAQIVNLHSFVGDSGDRIYVAEVVMKYRR